MFAHWTFMEDSKKRPEKISFKSQQIKAWAGNLYWPSQIWAHTEEISDEDGSTIVTEGEAFPPSVAPRERYEVTCGRIAHEIEMHLFNNKPKKRHPSRTGPMIEYPDFTHRKR
jgi:hypothetical protein